MRVITTHMSADFDAFASAVCAVRLYPGYRILFPGSLEITVRRFLEETRYPFPEVKLREARRSLFEHVVVVDTNNTRRLGEVWQLIESSQCRLTVIDHHEADGSTLRGDENHIRTTGATSTIISEMMREQGLNPTSEEASLLLMGIYEDTGGLSFRDTMPEDLREAAHLIESGGHLQWVRRWVLKALEPDQLEMLNRLVEGMEETRIHDVPVVVTMVEIDRYHEEAAYVVHRWMEIFRIPVCAAILVRPPSLTIILRSRLHNVDVSSIAEAFGGGGHPTAASATFSHLMPVEARERLMHLFHEILPPPIRAIDIANKKIFSVDHNTSVRETKETINQLSINALTVRDENGLVGMVNRQNLDNAMNHRLGDRPVKAVMHPGLPTAEAGASLEQLRDDFLQGSHRFIIVLEDGEPAGLITRMELFRYLFERQSRTGSVLDRRIAGTRPVRQNLLRKLRESIPFWVAEILAVVREVAEERGDSVYLVGGFVRDLLLGRKNEDLDLVVEGDGIAFGESLAAKIGARAHPHEPFKTVVLTLEGGRRVDVVSARTEFYRTPAALPDVITSLIRQDLFRRDFTINALAIVLHGDDHGQLIDFFGGRKDLDRREIRVLHSLSFIDDPTRMIRAVRYARRLDFMIAKDTRNLLATALEEGVFDHLSGQRLFRELDVLMTEEHPTSAMTMLAELGVLKAITPTLEWSEALRSHLLQVEGQRAWFHLESPDEPVCSWLLFLGALAHWSGRAAVEALADRLRLAGTVRRSFVALPDEVDALCEVAAQNPARSKIVHAVERHSSEALLIAMTRMASAERRGIANAVSAGKSAVLSVRGRDLIAAGIRPGPHVGEALSLARDALIDGDIGPDRVLESAVSTARRLMEEGTNAR